MSHIFRLLRYLIYPITRFFVYGFFRVYYGIRVRGKNLLPPGGGYILAVSHASFIDPFLIGAANPDRINFMARSTLWDSKAFHLIDWMFGPVIPVKRGAPDRAALRQAFVQLEKGNCILMFPEGTRSRDGGVGPVKKGPAFIADKTGAPIVPVVLKGAFKLWPRGKKIPSPIPQPFNRLDVRYGEPIYIQDYSTLQGKAKLEHITRMLQFRMQELFDDNR